MSRLRQIHQRLGEEDGVVTAFVVIFTLALVLLAGLVVDGGLTLAARVNAGDEAQEAARAGAQAIDLPLYRATGQIALDPQQADQVAKTYLAAVGDQGTVQVTGDQVHVTVSVSQPMQILEVVGIKDLTVSASATAVAEHGVNGPGT
jgi:hypothetical protein